MAAGKTTVARLLAARFARGVHLEGDLFRRSIVSGREEMTPEPSPEALNQLRLRYRRAAAAADGYFDADFTVALEDVVAGPLLSEYRMLIRSRPCHVVVLMPSLDEIQARAASRPSGYTNWTPEALYKGFQSGTPRVGLWLDTSDLTADETVDAILDGTDSERRPVVIVDYDSDWPELFRKLAAPVRQALGDLALAVEHVGSTAVPGLAAKPVIDIDVVVSSTDDVPEAIERLREFGYIHQGDKGITGREAFMWPQGAPPHHLYIVVAGNKPHLDHLQFRDYLREHSDVAAEYGSLKKQLADRHGDDRVAYTAAKTEFIARALRDIRPSTSARGLGA